MNASAVLSLVPSVAVLGASPEPVSSAYTAGRWLGMALLALPAILMAVKAWRAKTTSLRLAAAGTALGLLFFIFPQLITGWNAVDNRGAWLATAVVKALCGAGGLACVIAALVLRQRDQGVGLALPVTGAVFSGLHLFLGLCLGLSPLLVASHAGTSWKLTLPDGRASVVLPSKQWQLVPREDGSVMFGNRLAKGKGLLRCQQMDEARFTAVKAALREVAEKTALKKEPPAFQEGSLPCGASFVFVIVRAGDPSGKGELLNAALTAWHKEKGSGVTVAYEGMIDASSDAMAATQLAGHREAARKICMSVQFEAGR